VRLNNGERATLHAAAREAIAHGLVHGAPPAPPRSAPAGVLGAPGAAFVTLRLDGRLRGCIGTLEAHRPLLVDVAENAFAAAFRDPRFAPVDAHEAGALHVHLSVLGPPEPLACRDEADLLARLRPGHDGLILREGARRATFLPSVWAELPTPQQFLDHLRRKAGLPAGYWSPTLEVLRYETEGF